MTRLAAATVAALSTALALPPAKAAFQANPPVEPSHSLLVAPVPREEIGSVAASLRHRQEHWKFLSDAQQLQVEEAYDSLNLKGYSAEPSTVTQLPNGRMVIKKYFTPDEGTKITEEALKTAFGERLAPEIRSAGRSLRESLGIGAINADLSIEMGKDRAKAVLTLILDAGVHYQAETLPPRDSGLMSSAGRAEIFGAALDFLTENSEPLIRVPGERVGAVLVGLALVRDHYTLTGDTRLAALAQMILTSIDRTPENFLRYSELGILTADELSQLPKQFQSAHDAVKQVTERIPSIAELEKRNLARGRPYAIGEALSLILAFEAESSACSKTELHRVRLEVALAGDAVARKAEAANTKDPKEIAAFIRDYLAKDYKHDYAPQKGINGFCQPIAIHVIDCSATAFLAHEQFRAAGIEAGLECIAIKDKDGNVDGNYMAHVYLFVDTPEGRTYFDFSRGENDAYVFSSNKPIIEMYAGARASDVMVSWSTTEISRMVGAVILEPYIDAKLALEREFLKEPRSLAQILADSPELTSSARSLREGFAALDKVTESKFLEALDRGSVEDLKKLFK